MTVIATVSPMESFAGRLVTVKTARTISNLRKKEHLQ